MPEPFRPGDEREPAPLDVEVDAAQHALRAVAPLQPARADHGASQLVPQAGRRRARARPRAGCDLRRRTRRAELNGDAAIAARQADEVHAVISCTSSNDVALAWAGEAPRCASDAARVVRRGRGRPAPTRFERRVSVALRLPLVRRRPLVVVEHADLHEIARARLDVVRDPREVRRELFLSEMRERVDRADRCVEARVELEVRHVGEHHARMHAGVGEARAGERDHRGRGVDPARREATQRERLEHASRAAAGLEHRHARGPEPLEQPRDLVLEVPRERDVVELDLVGVQPRHVCTCSVASSDNSRKA